MKVKQLNTTVGKMLLNYPDLRDCDIKLIATIWRAEIRKQSLPECEEFFKILLTGQLSHPESIMRCRRKVQEDDPLMRGKRYEQRQRAAEDFKRQINLF